MEKASKGNLKMKSECSRQINERNGFINVKLTKENYGSNIIIGIGSKRKRDVVRYFNGIYNFNGCPSSARLHWNNSKDNGEKGKNHYFAKFQTTEERFIQSLCDLRIFQIIKDGGKETKEVKSVSIIVAKRQYEEIERDEFLNDNKISCVMSGW